VLTRKSNGPKNSSYNYRSSHRKASHVNKRFKRRVEEAVGHPYLITDVENTELTAVNGTASWSSFNLGTADQILSFQQTLYQNQVGWDVHDPNIATPNESNVLKNRYIVRDYIRTATYINESSAKVHVTMYTLVPRHDLAYSSCDPYYMLSNFGATGDLISNETPNVALPFYSPYFTPFQCPVLCQNYKIMQKRSFMVHAGGKFQVTLRHSFPITAGLDFNVTALASFKQWARKPNFRAVLIKCVGELGIVKTADGASRAVRHLPISIVGRLYTNVKLHNSSENRVITKHEDIQKALNASAYTASEIINEETLASQTVVKNDITTYS